MMGVPITSYNTGIGLGNAGLNAVQTVNGLQLQAQNLNAQNSGGGFLGGLLGSVAGGFGKAIGGLFF